MGGAAQLEQADLGGINLLRLGREEAEAIFGQGREAVIFALLKLAQLAATANSPTPSTPSSQIPPFKKPNSTTRRKKAPGRKPGHEGARREKPLRIDRTEERTLDARLDELIRDPDVKRLTKRLAKYRHALFTFLDEPGVSFDNNLAEREIRPAVLIRKNSFHNMSSDGATTQAILMTLYRTLKLRGHDPIETLVSTLRQYLSDNFTLPPLPPANNPSDG